MSQKVEINKADAPINQTMLFICEKCGKKVTKGEDPDDNLSRKMQKVMKKMSVERFGKKVVRPMVSSCMDLCPEGLITVGIMDMKGQKAPQFITVNPADPEDMAKAVFDTCLS